MDDEMIVSDVPCDEGGDCAPFCHCTEPGGACECVCATEGDTCDHGEDG